MHKVVFSKCNGSGKLISLLFDLFYDNTECRCKLLLDVTDYAHFDK